MSDGKAKDGSTGRALLIEQMASARSAVRQAVDLTRSANEYLCSDPELVSRETYVEVSGLLDGVEAILWTMSATYSGAIREIT